MTGNEQAQTLGIGRRLTLAFAALALVTLVVVALALVGGQRLNREIAVAEDLRRPALQAATLAQAGLLRMQLHLRGYLVLSDPQDLQQYQAARRQFERSLEALQAMSASWPEADAARRVAELTADYRRWVELPQTLFDLHDNPLKNRPALRLARVELQTRRVQVLDHISRIIDWQRSHAQSDPGRELLADLLRFQSSFDAMATNLIAFGASGELSFKLAYGPQLSTNAAAWAAVNTRRTLLGAEQRGLVDEVGSLRAEVAQLALQIISIQNGERPYEDLYLYRTQVAPQAEALLDRLDQLTAAQQTQLGGALTGAMRSIARARLADVAVALLAVLAAVVLAYRFRRSIVGPVRRLTEVARRVASGDLSARATLESRDEIGVLASSINTMTQRLAETIAHLETVFAEARRARDAAEVANRAKSSFLANMSHELRTPLNAVLGYAQILQREPGLTERQLAGVDTIRRGGEHLLALINDVLDLARIEAGKVELYPEPVALAQLLELINGITRVNAEQKGLRYACESAPDLPRRVLADGKRLEQVLLNLLGNAVKFTAAGSVTLRLQRLACDDPGSARLGFTIEDTGIGITPEQLPRLFLPFEQAEDVQRQYGGTGLGLAISQQLVTLMGGRIEVESLAGQGSRFRFELILPIAPAAPAAPASAAALSIVGYLGRRREVLVVDDVAANRASLVDLLAPLGFVTHQAGDGISGLRKARACRPDLILMDSVMPTVDGLEATRQLRADPALRDVPVVVLSASASAQDRERSLQCGANAFLPKPIDLDALLRTIGTLLRLEWTETPSGSAPADDALPLPPADELETLYQLARLGNMHHIRLQADHLAALDAAYRPFAQRLREFADGFQSRALLQWVDALRRRAGQGGKT